MPATPKIITNHHTPRILYIVPSRLHLDLMRGSKDAHIRPKHGARPNRDEPAVEDCEVEVSIEAWTNADIAAVVDAKGGLDERVWSDRANDVFKLCFPLRGERVEVCSRIGVRKPVVVFVGPGAGPEACRLEFGREGVVAVDDVSVGEVGR
ncbi:hypothetical protein EJ05DRAFT_185090 [Pseudovirgaria hyperparasitica]|uniref:Uncharacterized protein n=1 Tax=Pseudovirgaria hyperparasitica TaxID=470096 RepID=A0A6A6WI53_9PEZI|nr:uncharacterized protein EJ05DRAFT_185090 [Pseudovirgaria hyperparasitica]KAF2761785.1 hypothetical protein EJ05DRAFT_185090 [Pseudovirgaria hyperparasitica]